MSNFLQLFDWTILHSSKLLSLNLIPAIFIFSIQNLQLKYFENGIGFNDNYNKIFKNIDSLNIMYQLRNTQKRKS